MRHVLVLGAGTAGTMVANKLRHRLDVDEWSVTVVDRDDEHHYQPGYLFVPFGGHGPDDLVRSRRRYLDPGVEMVYGEIDRVEADDNAVHLADGARLDYDQLIIATGATIRPDQTEGMNDGEWRRSVFDFYSLDGATALSEHLARWEGGRLVVHITELPIKCPVAPLEFAFLADAFFTERGMRDRVEITYVTPLDGAFTKPVAAAFLGDMLAKRGIELETDFMIERVDPDAKTLVSFDEREVPFDLLVTVPLHMGAEFLSRSGLGDELGFVPVDKATMQSTEHANIFALGDAANLPTSKAGSVAHFAADVFADNFVAHVAGLPMTGSFDGHANCFVETGNGKGLLIDFNYDTQPLPGKYPLPGIGPFSLLRETEANHWGKLMFKWVYWNVLLPGRELPLPALMSMAGKDPDAAESSHEAEGATPGIPVKM